MLRRRSDRKRDPREQPVTATELFGRYVDLTPLHGRTRGLVRCLFHHPDRRGSLSFELVLGVLYCFACGARDDLRDFRRLLGEETAIVTHRRRRPAESTPQQAWRRMIEVERRAEVRRAEWGPWHSVNAYCGRCRRAVRDARQIATKLGRENPRTWPLLEHAARVEADGPGLEAELDTLAVGRFA